MTNLSSPPCQHRLCQILIQKESEYFSSLPESAQILSSASPLVINLSFIFQYNLPLILEDYCFGGSVDVDVHKLLIYEITNL